MRAHCEECVVCSRSAVKYIDRVRTLIKVSSESLCFTRATKICMTATPGATVSFDFYRRFGMIVSVSPELEAEGIE